MARQALVLIDRFLTAIQGVGSAAVDCVSEVVVAQEHLTEPVHFGVLEGVDAQLVKAELAQLLLMAHVSNLNFLVGSL